jgi:hypothetical protein
MLGKFKDQLDLLVLMESQVPLESLGLQAKLVTQVQLGLRVHHLLFLVQLPPLETCQVPTTQLVMRMLLTPMEMFMLGTVHSGTTLEH